MPYKEREIEKKYFSIGEVADMFEVAPSLIRFWETEFDNIKPKKDKKGNRKFTQSDIENIRLVFHLVKEKGYTHAGAKDIIKNKGQKAQNNVEAIESLKKVKSFLEELKNQLQ